jgi:hypothetical protein
MFILRIIVKHIQLYKHDAKFSAFFPYGEKYGSRFMISPCYLCICESPLKTFECLKHDMYIMAPEVISTAYFINPSQQAVCLCVCPSFRYYVKTLP